MSNKSGKTLGGKDLIASVSTMNEISFMDPVKTLESLEGEKKEYYLELIFSLAKKCWEDDVILETNTKNKVNGKFVSNKKRNKKPINKRQYKIYKNGVLLFPSSTAFVKKSKYEFDFHYGKKTKESSVNIFIPKKEKINTKIDSKEEKVEHETNGKISNNKKKKKVIPKTNSKKEKNQVKKRKHEDNEKDTTNKEEKEEKKNNTNKDKEPPKKKTKISTKVKNESEDIVNKNIVNDPFNS